MHISHGAAGNTSCCMASGVHLPLAADTCFAHLSSDPSFSMRTLAATAKEPNELIKIVTNACADVEVTSMFSECQHEKTTDIKKRTVCGVQSGG